MNTTGEIYFAIKTENPNVNLLVISEFLSIKPTTYSSMYEKGNVPKCNSWIFSSKSLTNPIYYEEIEKLIDVLLKHEEEFMALKKYYFDITFTLQIVMYLGHETPALSFSKTVLNFVNKIGATIDCDIYNSLK